MCKNLYWRIIAMRITERNKVEEMLSLDYNWTIKQRWYGWEEKDFNLNAVDVEDVIKDIFTRKYYSENLRPWAEVVDGIFQINYPNHAILIRNDLKVSKQ
jgi:hypothetical protein